MLTWEETNQFDIENCKDYRDSYWYEYSKHKSKEDSDNFVKEHNNRVVAIGGGPGNPEWPPAAHYVEKKYNVRIVVAHWCEIYGPVFDVLASCRDSFNGTKEEYTTIIQDYYAFIDAHREKWFDIKEKSKKWIEDEMS